MVDRFIQQAILQVLSPGYDPTFSRSSYGVRPNKSAHQALEAGRAQVASGKVWVVDLDLEKFFDRVNHDVLLGRLVKRIGDPRVLRVIRRYLEAGVLADGVVIERHEGTPQGGPLSPLLANILLDDLDWELERRGHGFCRYADDIQIYVQSQRAGERVLASVARFLERKLRLKVNHAKSAVAPSAGADVPGLSHRWPHAYPVGRGARACEAGQRYHAADHEAQPRRQPRARAHGAWHVHGWVGELLLASPHALDVPEAR
jgi:RNA-directed DNA polymerase